MSEGPVRITVRIFGEEYSVKAAGVEPEHIERIAAYVDRKMRQVAQSDPRLGHSRAAVLTALNLADELFRLQEQYERLLSVLEKEWEARKRPADGSGGAAEAQG